MKTNLKCIQAQNNETIQNSADCSGIFRSLTRDWTPPCLIAAPTELDLSEPRYNRICLLVYKRTPS